MNNNQFFNNNQFINNDQLTNNNQFMNNKKPSKNNKNLLLIVYIVAAISLIFGGYKLGLFDSFSTDANKEVESPVEIEKPKETQKPTNTTKPTETAEPTQPTPTPIETPVVTVVNSTSISITNTNPTISIGSTIKLDAKILPENTTDKTIIWTSSNQSIATVDSSGNVTGIALGNATITAKNGEVTANVQVTVSPVEVTSITLNKTSTTIVVEGSETITATIKPAGATNKTITWASSDESIATVNNGTIVGKKVGKATITATCGAKSANITVTVNKKPSTTVAVKSVTLNKTSATLSIGNSTTIVATVNPDNATNKTITWTSSDESIVSVNNGIITGKKVGTATITATSGKKSASVKITVNPIKVKSISLNKTSTSIVLGNKETITVTINPTNATDKNVTWSSSDKTVATVSNGVINAKAVGTAKITAKCDGKKASINVTVTPVLAKSITLSKTSSNMIVGNSETIKATINPSNTTNKTIKWSSNNTKVATVDQTGKITAVKTGTAKITASIDSVSATITVKVLAETTDVIDAYFINTQNAPNMTTTYTSNLAVLLKTVDNKYVLYDTAHKDDIILNNIYNKLKKEQNSDNVVIDYLILSHMHTDHYGNFLNIIKRDNIKVNNIIIKYEELTNELVASQKNSFKNIINAAIKEGSKIYTSPNMTASKMKALMGKDVAFSTLSEGQRIKLDNYVNMYFYNVDDVFKNYNISQCVTGQVIKYTSKVADDVNYFKTSSGEYVYYDNTSGQYPNGTLNKTKNLQQVRKGFNSIYYAYIEETRNTCRNNPNSLAIMVTAKTNSSAKYIYLTGDLDNNGYDVFPTTVSGYTNKVHGTGGDYLYKNLSYDAKNKKFITPIKGIKIAAETDTAKRIAESDTFKGKLKNIVIYQESHHGLNNAKDAIDILNLNRTGVYAIASTENDLNRVSSLLANVSYYYSIGKIPEDHKMKTGNKKNGIKCKITYNTTVKCEDY